MQALLPNTRLLDAIKPLRPFMDAEVFGLRRDWKVFSHVFKPVGLEFVQSAGFRSLSPIFESLRRTTDLFKPIFEDLRRHEEEARRVEDAGWLPHYTTPFELLDDPDLSTEAIAQILVAHYVDGWSQVRATFEAAVQDYDVDTAAKAAMIEALDSHQAGRFRSVVALLFNEIERVTRVEFHGGAPVQISSVHSLQEAAGSLEPSELAPSGMAGMRLFGRLVNHLYVTVKTSADVERLVVDPVPNRHAATHGLVIYGSAKNSLNTLIMADYVFQVVTVVKARQRQEAAA
ncbi:hypothetical protein DDF67_23940 [Caulobacter endophyticus]|uniref:Uncharacterized protein n=2 Tax=Caulobacter endophyticus TaxID=2172652 RepID=A0A2T9JEH2_9CAUL|nr:hypothetical protein DDF67_23940 [Caulobacter endophyticus]